MRLILAEEEGLNAIACDRLLSRLTEAKARSSPEITVDLSNAAFVDPYGAACLALMARMVNARGQQLACVLPNSEATAQAMTRLGLVSALQSLADVRNLVARHGHKSDSTLPLSSIRTRSDVKDILDYLVDLAENRLSYEVGDVLDATKIVSELCYNVLDHSGAEGLAAARFSTDRQGRRYVALAVVDAGVGIRASLARRYPAAAHWRHGEAIERALSGLSSRQQGGGLGLRSVHVVVRRYGGRLAIRSGNERLYVSAKHQPRTLSGVSFPGTQVGISFSQRV